MDIFNLRLYRKQSQGLWMLIDGMSVQIESCKWHLGLKDISEEAQKYWRTRLKVLEYWKKEAESAYNGDLHF